MKQYLMILACAVTMSTPVMAQNSNAEFGFGGPGEGVNNSAPPGDSPSGSRIQRRRPYIRPNSRILTEQQQAGAGQPAPPSVPSEPAPAVLPPPTR